MHVASGSEPFGSREATAEYYKALTFLYQWYGGRADGWHYGVYDRAWTHEAALARCNEVLLEGVPLERELRVLDVGCGEGGLSVWTAQRGGQVVGVTLVREHVGLARSLAASKGVGARCRFFVADMDLMAIGANSMDVVVNQETLCHSRSKGSYLADVFRVLTPGGWFRSVDLSVKAASRAPRAERSYQAVLRGFEIASLVSAAEFHSMLASAGFVDVVVRDMTRYVLPTALLIIGGSLGFHVLTQLGLDGLVYGQGEPMRTRYRHHSAACVNFNWGLFGGPFCYLHVSARKPS